MIDLKVENVLTVLLFGDLGFVDLHILYLAVCFKVDNEFRALSNYTTYFN